MIKLRSLLGNNTHVNKTIGSDSFAGRILGPSSRPGHIDTKSNFLLISI